MQVATPSYFLKKNYFSIISGLTFLVIFSVVYLFTETDLYWLRDDGVITLSHAKNFIDYGFIGVNPSGERVEGFSTPVQFWVYTILYAVFGMGYEAYAYFQLIVCTFLLGYTFSLFFEKSLNSFIIVTISALSLTFFKGFFLWHGSGMENPITHLLFLTTFYILYNAIRKNNIQYSYSFVVFLATIARLDSVYHIAPLLVIFSIWWFLSNKKDSIKKFEGLIFSFAVFVLWLSYNIYRYIYFGDIMPNTAHVQNIDVIDRFYNISLHIKSSILYAGYIAWMHGLVYMAFIIPVTIYLYNKDNSKFSYNKNNAILFLLTLIVCITFTVLFNGLVFGPGRLDTTRSTTYAPVFVFLALGIMLVVLQKNNMLKVKYIKYVILLLLSVNIVLNILIIYAEKLNPKYAGKFEGKLYKPFMNKNLCCGINLFDKGAGKEFRKWQKQEQLHRPMVSNIDLGIVSYRKQFNMFDLGWLGSLATAHIKQSYNDMYVSAYINWFSPDYVNIQLVWACFYHKFLNDEQFRSLYKIQYESEKAWEGCSAKTTRAIRKATMKNSQSPERLLINTMSKNPNANKLRQELKNCEARNKGITDCIYVARTAYRFAPELRKKGLQVELENIFSNSRTAPFDMYLITGYKNPQSVHKALDFIRQHEVKINNN